MGLIPNLCVMDIANIKASDLELTPAITAYVERKLEHLDKFLSSVGEPKQAFVEVEKTTRHHKSGDIFRCEVMIKLPGKTLRAESNDTDLYAAIDAVRDALERQVIQYKETR